MTSQNMHSGLIRDEIDLHSILAASQLISSELTLERLLNRIINIVRKVSDAERGFLVLEQNEKWEIAAYFDGDQLQFPVSDGIVLDDDELPAESVIHYVARTQETVNLVDAVNSGEFTDDSTIQRRGIRSLLCIPLVHKGESTGILYLENNPYGA